MTATPTENTNFFWHCLVAAKLIDELPSNAATSSHSLRAVRMATVCAAGRNGVQFASHAARERQESTAKHWDQCGLIKEHVVPVSLIHALVQGALKSTRAVDPAKAAGIPDEDLGGLTAGVVDLFRKHPRAWLVAKIVQDWTLLAWITESENERFDDKTRHGMSLRKSMPQGWTEDQDRFARYNACEIAVSKI